MDVQFDLKVYSHPVLSGCTQTIHFWCAVLQMEYSNHMCDSIQVQFRRFSFCPQAQALFSLNTLYTLTTSHQSTAAALLWGRRLAAALIPLLLGNWNELFWFLRNISIKESLGHGKAHVRWLQPEAVTGTDCNRLENGLCAALQTRAEALEGCPGSLPLMLNKCP